MISVLVCGTVAGYCVCPVWRTVWFCVVATIACFLDACCVTGSEGISSVGETQRLVAGLCASLRRSVLLRIQGALLFRKCQ